MDNKKRRKLAPKQEQADLDALDALDAIADYAPSNPAYTKDNGRVVRTAEQAAKAKETQDEAQAKASRDSSANAVWDVHEFVQGVIKQVEAQYGSDSDEYASLGFKKKSEYKKPSRKPKAT